MENVNNRARQSVLATMTNDDAARVVDNGEQGEAVTVQTVRIDNSQSSTKDRVNSLLDNEKENIDNLSVYEDKVLKFEDAGSESNLAQKRKFGPVDYSELVGAEGGGGSPATMFDRAVKRVRYNPKDMRPPPQPDFTRQPGEHKEAPAVSTVDVYVDPSYPRPDDPLWRLAHGWPIERTQNPYLFSAIPTPSYTANEDERAASPVYSPPSPSAPHRDLPSGPFVDWTFVPDAEDDGCEVQQTMNPVQVLHSASSSNNSTPALSSSSDPESVEKSHPIYEVDSKDTDERDDASRDGQAVSVISDDPGYEAASEWEEMSESSLEFICRNHGGIRLVSHSNDDATRGSIYVLEASVCDNYYQAHDLELVRPSTPVLYRVPRTPSPFMPSPMNSEDCRRADRLGSDYEPSPLNSRDLRNIGDHHSYPTASFLRSVSGSSRSIMLEALEGQAQVSGMHRAGLYHWNEPASPTPATRAISRDSLERRASASYKSPEIYSVSFASNEEAPPAMRAARFNGLSFSADWDAPDVRVPPRFNCLSRVVDWNAPALPVVECVTEVKAEATLSEDGIDAICEAIEDDEGSPYSKKIGIQKWAEEVWPGKACEL